MMATIWVMWLEKVDRLCSMDCSSPMSAYISLKTARRLPGSARMGRPDWAIRWVNPRVLSKMVFPARIGTSDDNGLELTAKADIIGDRVIDEGMADIEKGNVLLIRQGQGRPPHAGGQRGAWRTKSRCPMTQALLLMMPLWGRKRLDISQNPRHFMYSSAPANAWCPRWDWPQPEARYRPSNQKRKYHGQSLRSDCGRCFSQAGHCGHFCWPGYYQTAYPPWSWANPAKPGGPGLPFLKFGGGFSAALHWQNLPQSLHHWEPGGSLEAPEKSRFFLLKS